MNTKIKICGITRVEDAERVVAAGVDALGLNFAAVSPRCVSTEQARRLSLAVAGDILRVGLFVDSPAAFVREVLSVVELDMLQFQGNEDAAFCGGFGLPYLKAFRVAERFDLARAQADYADACALHLDAYVAGVPGGTGQRLNAAYWPSGGERLVLAGGLTPGNVRAAVEELKPFAVDVCGGVETARKGIKDPDKIVQFVREVRSAGR